MAMDPVRVRLGISAILLVGLFLAAAVKAIQVQLVEHPRWAEAAERIQTRELVQAHPRGRIYDRNGLLLALDVKAVSVALDNLNMTKPELLEGLLVKHLGLSREEARERVYRPKYFTWLARKLDPEAAERLREEAEALGVQGLLFLPEWKRVYPQGALASNVIGFAGLDNRGLEGLELALDAVLRGKEERREVVRGADGTLLELRVIEEGRPGADLHLSLDARVQLLAERVIQRGVARYRAKGGFAVVMDPKTGEILALAQDKTYDLNAFARSTPAERKNLGVVQPFEPGSTFKPFAMLAALEAGVISVRERVSGDSPVVIAGHPFRNAEHRDYGPVTPAEVIQKSINTGMIRIAQRLGEERLYAFLRRLRVGEETGVELPGEVPGVLRPVEAWSALEIGAIPIGQGVSVTGVQLAAQYAALANGGRLLAPSIVRAIELPGGELRGRSPEERGRVASSANVRKLVEMLRLVVQQDGGTGVYANVEGFDVAGKSGTGQKAIPGRGYVKGKYTSLFAGFFPASDPQYVILVVLDEVGTRAYYGGLTAAPLFREIVEGIVAVERLKPGAGSPRR